MKKLIIITACLLACGSAFAQDWTVVSNDKAGHESYLTNDWRDNLFVGIGGGLSTRFTTGSKSDIKKMFIDPALNVYLLKWFTPRVGARIGYLGISGREGLNAYNPYQINHSALPYQLKKNSQYVSTSSEPGTLHYGSFQINGDLVWNLTNTLTRYRKDRFLEVSLYGTGGYLRLYDNITEKRGLFGQNYDREFVLGGGIFTTFRLSERLFATADLRYSNFASRYRSNSGVRTSALALNVGVTYNLFRTNWTNMRNVQKTVKDAETARDAAEKKVKETQATNTNLERRITVLQNEIKEYKYYIKLDSISIHNFKERAAKADLIVYFFKGLSTLNFAELYHVQNYAKTILEKEPDHVFKVTGSADKGTGTPEENEKLSKNRALYIKGILMKEFGVKEENIIISSVVTDKNIDGGLDRCALIEK